MDSDGNVLTDSSFAFGAGCSQTIDQAALVLYDAYVKICEDSADRPCVIGTTRTPRDTALFPYRIGAGMNWSVSIGGDPPFKRGDRIDIVIDLLDGGQVRDEQVM
jgi:hypothetical protein